MQMTNREYVEGTEPAIYIGHRVYRRPDGTVGRSKSWHAEYTVDSRQRSKALGTPTKAAAIRAAHALCDKLRQGIDEKPLKRVKVSELTELYIETLTNRGRSPKTMTKYRFNLNEFRKWWESKGDKNAATFTPRDFWAYRKHLAELGKSEHTIEDRLVLVKQLFKWAAHKAKAIPINPIADESVPEVPPTPQPCFTPEQVEKLIAAAKPKHKPLFIALAYSGLRIGELVALRWQDVILDKGQYGHLHIRLGGSNGTTKGKSSRLIPIHPMLREVLDALPKVHERVFLRPPTSRYPEGHHPINDRHLLSIVKKLCKRCGFPGWEKFKLHTFRHAFASMCARNQVSYKYALNWMGHKNSDILDMYVTMYDDAADMAMQTISYSRPTAATSQHVTDVAPSETANDGACSNGTG